MTFYGHRVFIFLIQRLHCWEMVWSLVILHHIRSYRSFCYTSPLSYRIILHQGDSKLCCQHIVIAGFCCQPLRWEPFLEDIQFWQVFKGLLLLALCGFGIHVHRRFNITMAHVIAWITFRLVSCSQSLVQKVCLRWWQEKSGMMIGSRRSLLAFTTSSEL